MDLKTTWMGMALDSPLVVGASPLSSDLDACRRLEENGASAVVMHSLFMEEIEREERQIMAHVEGMHDAHAEALSYLPEVARVAVGPVEYLEQVRRLKQALDVPVIASLNGIASGRWVRYARLIEQAGADGIELNIYYLPLDGTESAAQVEDRHLSVLAAVREQVEIPVALKLTHYFSSPVHFARRLEAAGAAGLVLFAPLFHTDLDVEQLAVVPSLPQSSPGTLRERLLWLAAIFGHVSMPLALSGGARSSQDMVKAVMAGASVVQMTTALLEEGPGHVTMVLDELRSWLVEHEYQSLAQMRGSMSLQRCPDPEAFERVNYMQVLQSWGVGNR